MERAVLTRPKPSKRKSYASLASDGGKPCPTCYAQMTRDKMEMTIACWDASRKTADRFHKRFPLRAPSQARLSLRRGRRGRKAHKSSWARPEPGAVSGPVEILASQQRERAAAYGPPGSGVQHIDTAHARGQ